MQTKSNRTFWTVSQENEVKISSQLPLIIWGDKHNSTLNYASLLSLLPYLAERGYSNFGFEYDNAINLESLMARVKKSLENAYQCKKIVDDNKLSFFDSSQQESIKIAVEVIPTLEKKIELFEQVKKLGWTYQGLDMNLGDKRSNFNKNSAEIGHQGALYEERNNTIVKHIVQKDQNVQGGGEVNLMGLRHCIGVSELLYQSLGKEANILFLYVFAADDPDIGVIRKQKEALVKKYEQQGILFNCELIVSDEHCLKNIKRAIEAANTKSIAIRKIDEFGELGKIRKQRQEAIQEVMEEVEEIKKFNQSLSSSR